MKVEGGFFLDDEGRRLLLRGCNLGANSKLPITPDGSSRNPAGLNTGSAISFVGRPFPLDQADEHFDRLSSWGFTFLRFVITWEALEHSGPGIYDEAYLAYVRKLLKKAEEYGFSVFMDPHQDVWSRWTGGDGAPAWTLEKLGMDLSNLGVTGAALTHQELGDAYPTMLWPSNYGRYAAATLFTLFFAGNAFAPATMIEGESAQDWLQATYIAAMRHSYRRLKDCRAIVGWGAMNEPDAGFVGIQDISKLGNCVLTLGPMPSAFQAMAAAGGHPQLIPNYSVDVRGFHKKGVSTLNPHGVRLFREGFECPWKQSGVWTDDNGEARILNKDHFARRPDGNPVQFVRDYLKPFIKRFAATLREVKPQAILFIEGLPHGDNLDWTPEEGGNTVNAFHWYDGMPLVLKRFMPFFSVRTDTRKPVFGRVAVEYSFAIQLADSVRWTKDRMGGMPCLLGEFGLPFDLNGKKAYATGDYRLHETAISMYYDAVDANLLSGTIWNYNPDNTHVLGDDWNGEDLSVWSRDGGARAIDGWRRPYPMAIAGEPLSIHWDRKARCFEFRFRADPLVTAPTKLYLPEECFGGNYHIELKPIGPACPYTLEKAVYGVILLSVGGYDGEILVKVTAD